MAVLTQDDLLEAIAKNKVPTPNFEDGVRYMEFTDAVSTGFSSRSLELLTLSP